MANWKNELNSIGSENNAEHTSLPSTRDRLFGSRIAVVTTIPIVANILTRGIEPGTLNKRCVSQLNIKPFLAKDVLPHIGGGNVHDVNISLFYAPALSGEWTVFDEQCQKQLKDALDTAGPFDRVINLCHAVPVFRRCRGENSNCAAEASSTIKFADTLTALLSLLTSLKGKVLEPMTLDRTSYAFRKATDNTHSIADMKVTSWIESPEDEIWASPTGIGLSTLYDLPVHDQVADIVQKSSYSQWFDDLEMGNLLQRFIYSDFKYDFESDVEHLWNLDDTLPIEQKILLTEQNVRDNSLEKLDRDCESTQVKNIEEALDRFTAVFEMYKNADVIVKMLDVSHLLLKKMDATKQLIKRFPFTVAFQKMWDRQAIVYDQKTLDEKTNAWYISNGLLHAKKELGEKLPPFTLWAIPILPTNSIRFVLRPKSHELMIRNAIVTSFVELVRRSHFDLVSKSK